MTLISGLWDYFGEECSVSNSGMIIVGIMAVRIIVIIGIIIIGIMIVEW